MDVCGRGGSSDYCGCYTSVLAKNASTMDWLVLVLLVVVGLVVLVVVVIKLVVLVEVLNTKAPLTTTTTSQNKKYRTTFSMCL